MEKNILKCYHRSTSLEKADGMVWYDVAHTFASGLAEEYASTTEKASGVIAALSPQVGWERNLIAAEQFFQKPNVKPKCVFGVGYRKALCILDGESPSDVLLGQKERSFHENIMLNPDYVTIDRHAIAIAYTDANVNVKILERKGEYERVADAYRNVAKRLGMLPYQLQAITWLTWRREQNELGRKGVRK